MKNFLKLFTLISIVFFYTSCDDSTIEPADTEGPTGTTGATGTTGTTGPSEPELDPYKDWMTILLNENQDREVTLQDICIPRAHDAGMYVLTTCEFGSNACNTQTQDLSMTEMLRRGVRMFDVRPVLAGGILFTQHKTACDGLGCRGDRIQYILDQVKSFVDCHAELVILEFGHFCDVSAFDQDLQDMVNNTLQDRLHKDDSDNNLINDDNLHDIIPGDEAKGKVVILYDGVSNTQSNRALGVFAHSYYRQQGSYANSHQVDVMKADQLDKYNSFNHNSTDVFKVSWTLTLNVDLSIQCANPFSNTPGIEGFAYQAHEALTPTIDSLIGVGSIAQGKIPNILSVDFADNFVTDECIKINEINMQ